MSDWRATTIGQVITLQRGVDITKAEQRAGSVPVVSSGGVSSYHDTAYTEGPGVVMGRKGSLGKVFFFDGPYWPHDTTLWVRDFKGNDPRFVYYFLGCLDTSFLDVGSANPTLNRNHVHPLPALWPDLTTQRAVAEVLRALDDKIDANAGLCTTAATLASNIYSSETASANLAPLSSLVHPILGGTPSRGRVEYWESGTRAWASAKDVTGAMSGIILDTEEHITDLAVAETKAKPLSRGGVILTARGTVGAVARVAHPTSFNQSCYGFEPGRLPAGCLYFVVAGATDQAKSMVHGSVFDTITMRTFDDMLGPELSADAWQGIEAKVSPLLELVESMVKESRHLAATRDALLPGLMSGKIKVNDAERVIERVV